MNSRKILSSIVAVATVIGSLSSVFAEYGTYGDNGSYTPPRKIQKLIKLESKLTPYLEGVINRRVQTIGDTRLKRQYLYEIGLQKEKIKQYFEDLQYTYSDDEYSGKLAELKAHVTTVRDLIVEAGKSQEAGVNPFVISESDRNHVEGSLLATQKDIVTILKNSLQMYENSDIKKMNPSSFHFEGEIGTIDVNLEKSTNILSWATGNQEADLTLTSNLDLKLPGGYKYDTNGNYVPETSKTLTGSVKIDGVMKSIDNDLYLTLNDYSLALSSDDATLTSEIAEVKTILDAAKGKTLHMPMPGSSEGKIDGKKALMTIKTVLDTLGKNTLFTPYKKIDNSFALEPSRSTIDAIAKALDTDAMSDDSYLELRKNFHATPLWYADTTGGYDIWMNVAESGTSGELRLSRLPSTSYVFTAHLANTSGATFASEIRKGYFKLDAQGQGSSANILWSGNALDARISTSSQNLVITGPLSSMSADLIVSLNSKDIGTMKITGTPTHSEYDIRFNADIPSPWKFSWKGTIDIEHGIYVIEKPADSVEFSTILPSKNSQFESGAFNPLDL